MRAESDQLEEGRVGSPLAACASFVPCSGRCGRVGCRLGLVHSERGGLCHGLPISDVERCRTRVYPWRSTAGRRLGWVSPHVGHCGDAISRRRQTRITSPASTVSRRRRGLVAGPMGTSRRAPRSAGRHRLGVESDPRNRFPDPPSRRRLRCIAPHPRWSAHPLRYPGSPARIGRVRRVYSDGTVCVAPPAFCRHFSNPGGSLNT